MPPDDLYFALRRELRQHRPTHPNATSTDDSQTCEQAEQFSKKLDGLIFGALAESPTLAQLAQAKFILQEEWQAWRRALPPDHRGDVRALPHQCVDETYHAAYDRLHSMHLRFHPTVNPIANYQELTKSESPPKKKRAAKGRPLFEIEDD